MSETVVPVTAVTGGTSGIGLATVRMLIERGHCVVALGLDDEHLEGVRGRFDSERCALVAGDVADPAASERLIATAVERWGRLTGLVTCAAVRSVGTVVDTPPEVWDRIYAVNVGGVAHACRAALAVMVAAGGGAIVNVGSASGYGGEGHAAYAASKGAVLSLSMSMALDHRHEHVRVNVVAPGSTRTAMNAGRDPRIDAAIAARSSVTGDLNTPDDVASAIAFLLSNEARNITGTILDVGYLRGEPVRRVDLG